MIRIVFFLLSMVLLTSCDDLCNSSASCVAPPEGEFQEGKINLAISQSLLERQEDGSFEQLFVLDSVVVGTSSANYTIRDFYTWSPIETGDILSLQGYSDETQIEVLEDAFIFNGGETQFSQGGFLLIFGKENGEFLLQIDKASQDLIDGVCNDVITDC